MVEGWMTIGVRRGARNYDSRMGAAVVRNCSTTTVMRAEEEGMAVRGKEYDGDGKRLRATIAVALGGDDDGKSDRSARKGGSRDGSYRGAATLLVRVEKKAAATVAAAAWAIRGDREE
ncbi:hypothetical protein B296_00049851 [Ensete ventricosum]|uniref:Uncharacterized protein n=1 Tax=Ensete ventricosum TaxID=4639 RepID=A0A426Y2I7_ENSVE|nr:hypothetical protein B296_00049851 [Ensete ventricosum]